MFDANDFPVSRSKAFPVVMAALAELHVTAKIRAKAAAKKAVPAEAMAAKAHFHAAEALGVPVSARFWTEPIHAEAAIRGVRPADAMAADRTVAATHCATVGARTVEAIRCAMGDLLRGSRHDLARSVTNHSNRAKAHCVRCPADCASEPESVRRFDIRFRAACGQGERSARPEHESAAQSSSRRFASVQFCQAQPRPDSRGSANRRDSDANRFQPRRFDSARMTGQGWEPGDVR